MCVTHLSLQTPLASAASALQADLLLLHRDAHRSECMHPLLGLGMLLEALTAAPSAYGQCEFELNFPNFP